jgi:hypothetical protein
MQPAASRDEHQLFTGVPARVRSPFGCGRQGCVQERHGGSPGIREYLCIVAGGVIYNGAHLYLSESSLAGLDKWRSAIDQVESLGARHIVAGHQNSKLDDDAARTIADTREYLDVAEEQLRTQNTAVDYFNAMVERYPDRLGRTVLWATAQAVFGIREHPGEDPTQFIAAGWL